MALSQLPVAPNPPPSMPDASAASAESASDFEQFVRDVEPRLRRALVGLLGVDQTADAVADAFAWAWENWETVTELSNPAGYLYRVARSSGRVRRPSRVKWLVRHDVELPHFEPGLGAALATLSVKQRAAVWLVHGCDWSYLEAAEALGVTPSTLGNHLSRGLVKLRTQLGEVSP